MVCSLLIIFILQSSAQTHYIHIRNLYTYKSHSSDKESSLILLQPLEIIRHRVDLLRWFSVTETSLILLLDPLIDVRLSQTVTLVTLEVFALHLRGHFRFGRDLGGVAEALGVVLGRGVVTDGGFEAAAFFHDDLEKEEKMRKKFMGSEWKTIFKDEMCYQYVR